MGKSSNILKHPGIRDLMPITAWLLQKDYRNLRLKNKLGHIRLFFLCLIGRRVSIDREVVEKRSGERSTLFVQSMRRPDYDELFENVLGAFPGAMEVVRFKKSGLLWGSAVGLDAFRFRRVPRFFLSAVADCCRFRRAVVESFFAFGAFRGVLSSFLILILARESRAILKSHPKKVVLFAEMQNFDRVLSWTCRRRGIPCATMQHGLYAEYENTPTENRWNYRPLFIDVFLAWGEETARLVSRNAPGIRTIVCGKPTFQEITPPVGENHRFDCVVILDQNLFKAENQRMLAIVSQAFAAGQGRLGVRLHPSNCREDYDLSRFEEAGDHWMSTHLFVAHSTSLMVDLVRAGCRLLRYATDCECAFRDARIEFTDTASFRERLSVDPPSSAEVTEPFISCIGKEAVRSHVDAILNLVPSGDF